MSSFVMLATFVPKAGSEAALLTELNGMVAPSVAEPGCLRYQPLLDPGRSGTVVMFEQWADREALESHFASPHFRRVASVLADLIEVPVSVLELLPSPAAASTSFSADDLRALVS